MIEAEMLVAQLLVQALDRLMTGRVTDAQRSIEMARELLAKECGGYPEPKKKRGTKA
jgi:hypothetical protein